MLGAPVQVAPVAGRRNSRIFMRSGGGEFALSTIRRAAIRATGSAPKPAHCA
jgi:hypothetical protein